MTLEDRRRKNLESAPIPYARIPGRKLLVHRTATDLEYGKYIVLPASVKDKDLKSTGTVVMIGEGYEDDCPFQLGDKVLLSQYVTVQIGLRVPRTWWEANDPQKLSHMDDVHREELVPFALVDESEIYADVTEAPEQQIWEVGSDGRSAGQFDRETSQNAGDLAGIPAGAAG